MSRKAMALLVVLGACLTQAAAVSGQEARSQSEALLAELVEEVRSLNAYIRSLEQRVAALEAKLGEGGRFAAEGVPQTDADWPHGRRLMQVEGISTFYADEEAYVEVEELERESEALQRTSDSLRDQAARLEGLGSSNVEGGSNREYERRRKSLVRLAIEYQARANRKHGEAARLRKELEQPKQVIVGADGQYLIELRTSRDLSRQLEDVEPGALLTWQGRRHAMDEISQIWIVWKIDIVDPTEIE